MEQSCCTTTLPPMSCTINTQQRGSMELWEALLGELTRTEDVTDLEATLLDAIMKERRPMLREAFVKRMDSCDLVGTYNRPRDQGTASAVQIGLDSLVEKQFVGAKTLPVPQPSEDDILYYPGRRLVERVRQCSARSNLDMAIGIIHHRPGLTWALQTEWLRRERDRVVLAKWQASSENGNTSAEDESLAAPPAKRARSITTEEDPLVAKEVAALRQQKIRALHEYNEAKDRAHHALGNLAESANCTVRDLYREFDIDERDSTLFL